MFPDVYQFETVGKLVDFLKNFNESDKIMYKDGKGSITVFVLEGEKNIIVF